MPSASSGAQKAPAGCCDASDQGFYVERSHRETQLATALPDRHLAPHAHDEAGSELHSHRGQVVLHDRPVPCPAGNFQRRVRVASRWTGRRCVGTRGVIGKFEVAVAAGLSDLADLAGDPDLAGKRLEERAADPVVEVAYGERGIRHRPGNQRRLVGDDREQRRRDARDLRRRDRDWLPGMILAGSEIETKFLDIRTSSPPGPAGAGHGLRLPVGREWPSGSGSTTFRRAERARPEGGLVDKPYH